jgi:hypothetical protein
MNKRISLDCDYLMYMSLEKTNNTDHYWSLHSPGYPEPGTVIIFHSHLPNGLVKVKTGANTDDTVYNGWYSVVYQSPTSEPTEQGQG